MALQFPDSLLSDAPALVLALRNSAVASTVKLFVLADTTYGAGCPDVVRATGSARWTCVFPRRIGDPCRPRTLSAPLDLAKDSFRSSLEGFRFGFSSSTGRGGFWSSAL